MNSLRRAFAKLIFLFVPVIFIATSSANADISINDEITLKSYDGTDEFRTQLTELWKKLRIDEFTGSFSSENILALKTGEVPDNQASYINSLKYQIEAFPPNFLDDMSTKMFLIKYDDNIVGLVRYSANAEDGEEEKWLDRLYIEPNFLSAVQVPILNYFSDAYAYILTGVNASTPEYDGYLDASWTTVLNISVMKKYKDYILPGVIVKGPQRQSVFGLE